MVEGIVKNKKFYNKKILVTGGTGSFGKTVTKYLLEKRV